MVIKRNNGQAWNASKYEYKAGALTVAGTTAGTDITTDGDFTNLFSVCNPAYYVKIEVSGDAYVQFNDTSGDVIPLTTSTPFESEFLEVKKIFVSTNNIAVTFTITLIS